MKKRKILLGKNWEHFGIVYDPREIGLGISWYFSGLIRITILPIHICIGW